VASINEYENFIKIKENIYSQGEGSDSPECFGFKRTGKID
jgi:hypothetical protein